MDVKQAAACIHGNEYRDEVPRDLRDRLKEAGLIAVYGASDDLTEFDGAIRDEAYSGEDSRHRLTRRGLEVNRCDEGDRCPNWTPRENNVRARWCPPGFDGSWLIETDLPHAPFDIMEDDELYCRGFVIALTDLPE